MPYRVRVYCRDCEEAAASRIDQGLSIDPVCWDGNPAYVVRTGDGWDVEDGYWAEFDDPETAEQAGREAESAGDWPAPWEYEVEPVRKRAVAFDPEQVVDSARRLRWPGVPPGAGSE